MFSSVHESIGKCAICARSKASNQKPMGLLQPLPLPSHCWEEVLHDLITLGIRGLPLIPRGYNATVTFVDRLSKRTIFVPASSSIDARGFADIFFKDLFRHFGLPKALDSDRDPRFTSHFWKSITQRLGTSLKLSTAHHPQMAKLHGLTAPLRTCFVHIVSPFQNDMDKLLIPAKFAYDNSMQGSTGFTPFYLICSCRPHKPQGCIKTNSPIAGTSVPRQLLTPLPPCRGECVTIHNPIDWQVRYPRRSFFSTEADFSFRDDALLSTKYLNLHLPGGATSKLYLKYTGLLKVNFIKNK